MSQYSFGSGTVWGTPLTDAYGNAIANPTPILVGVLQDVSVDISFDVKQMYGQNQFPVAVGRGKGKIDGKASMGQINGAMLNNLIFGQTVTSGQTLNYRDLTGSTIPSTPFTVTPTVPSSGTWAADLGVLDSNGVPLTRVASAPTTGQYSVSAGVYTFAAADTGKTVFISFQYSITSAVAMKQIISNVGMGAAPTFRMDLTSGYAGKSLSLSLYNCMSTKLTLATKQDDFMIPEFTFSAFADGANRIGMWSTSE